VSIFSSVNPSNIIPRPAVVSLLASER